MTNWRKLCSGKSNLVKASPQSNRSELSIKFCSKINEISGVGRKIVKA